MIAPLATLASASSKPSSSTSIVCSVHPEAGLSTGDFEEACIKRALCQAAAETIVLASPEKLATASPYQVVPLAQLGGIVALASTPEALLAPYRKLGIAIHPA